MAPPRMQSSAISMSKKLEKPLHPGSEGGRRLLVAAGTAHYDHLVDADLNEVPAEVQRVVDALSNCGYQRCLAELSQNPSSTELRGALPAWFREPRDEDVTIFYYTSHGYG